MEEMISVKGMLSLAFLKKERFTGSCKKMRYMICKEEENLKAVTYPGPYCLEKTPEDLRQEERFDFSAEGLKQAVEWLNLEYREKYL